MQNPPMLTALTRSRLRSHFATAKPGLLIATAFCGRKRNFVPASHLNGAASANLLRRLAPQFSLTVVAASFMLVMLAFGATSAPAVARSAPAALPSVQGLHGKHLADRRRGLAVMKHIWQQARVHYGQPQSTLPRVLFTHIPLVSTIYTPGRRISTQQVLWPDWLNEALIAPPQHRTADGFTSADALAMLVHEWSHYYQRDGLTDTLAEGGAQLLTRRIAPAIATAVGLRYHNPAFRQDQYPQEMAAVKRRGEQWIRHGQLVNKPGFAGTAGPPSSR